jgi:hypothetical protein
VTAFSNEEKRAEAAREIKYRLWVYGRKDYKDSAAAAADRRRLLIMTEIEADYAKLAEKERLL